MTFDDGGFCNATKRIRTLTVDKDQEQLYLCSNLTSFSDQLCRSTEKFRVEQQQTCIEPNITLCKYDMKLLLLNFGLDDEGMYNVKLEFENDRLGRGMLIRQFNVTVLSALSDNGKYVYIRD